MKMNWIVVLVSFAAVLISITPWPSVDQTGLVQAYAPAYSVVIQSVKPVAPYCVLRNSPYLYERLLTLTGQNFSTTSQHLQFRNIATGDVSLNFHMEVNWDSSTQITVDMARIKHLLWSDPKLTLVVRITDLYYQPVSEWSPSFTLADNSTVCGIAPPTPTPVPPPTRGVSGDLWADRIIGKPDFSEFTPYEVVPSKIFNPGGVFVDRSVNPGRAYIWDSGNSRILGIDLAKCYANIGPCSADIVIGQPSGFDSSACNGDSGFQRYPDRARATASTLCGIEEDTLSIMENKSFVSMVTDQQGNLYAPDRGNHRVLKYVSPFTTDKIADEVWGQTDFSGNSCNRGYSPSTPTAVTLCFLTNENGYHVGAGVELDSLGNLWVADGGNNRVLRFPKDAITGVISKTADLVLGQTNFTGASAGTALDKMDSPAALRFSSQGWLYVADSINNRILVFKPPFLSGMSAASTFGSQLRTPLGLEMDLFSEGVWVYDFGNKMLELWDWNGNTVRKVLGKDTYKPDGNCQEWLCDGGGGFGIDAQGNILPSVYVYVQDVLRFKAPIPTPQPGVVYQPDKRLFYPPPGYNKMGLKGLKQGQGIVVNANQLVIADAGRLLFWNNPGSLTNGKLADGFIGNSDFSYQPDCCGRIKADSKGRLWVQRYQGIEIYQLPLKTGAVPQSRVSVPSYPLPGAPPLLPLSGDFRLRVPIPTPLTLPVLGGGSLSIGTRIEDLVPMGQGEFLWISDTNNHRVLRIRNPLDLATAVVDVVLGQTNPSGNQCNHGLVPPPNVDPNQNPSANMLCYPGGLSLDRYGNLYVSDHAAEVEGNWRLLIFSASLFPNNNTTAIFAPASTKIFPRQNTPPAATFQPAFDSRNRMVVGYNPYLVGRFVGVYNDPLGSVISPDAYLKDYYSWPLSATFDQDDNLYIGDGNRSRVLIYWNPFDNPTAYPIYLPNISKSGK